MKKIMMLIFILTAAGLIFMKFSSSESYDNKLSPKVSEDKIAINPSDLITSDKTVRIQFNTPFTGGGLTNCYSMFQ